MVLNEDMEKAQMCIWIAEKIIKTKDWNKVGNFQIIYTSFLLVYRLNKFLLKA